MFNYIYNLFVHELLIHVRKSQTYLCINGILGERHLKVDRLSNPFKYVTRWYFIFKHAETSQPAIDFS